MTTTATTTNGHPKPGAAGPGKRVRRKFPALISERDLDDPDFAALLSYLKRFREKHSCGPSVRDIGRELGWGYERVRCAVNHLVDSGWLTRQVGLGYRDMRITKPEERAEARKRHWEAQVRLLGDDERACLFAACLAHPAFPERCDAPTDDIDLHTQD